MYYKIDLFEIIVSFPGWKKNGVLNLNQNYMWYKQPRWQQGRLWAHLLPGTAQLQLLTEQLQIRTTWRPGEEISAIKDVKKEPQQAGLGSKDTALWRLIPQVGSHGKGGKGNFRDSLQGARGLSPELGCPVWGSCTGKTNP